MIKVLGYLIAGTAMLAVIILAIGAVLPAKHTAAVRVHLKQPPDSVYNVIVDVEHSAWRDVSKVEVLVRDPLTWRETASYGTLTFVSDEMKPHTRFVTRIADVAQGFGGKWTYDVAPDNAGGSVVTIRENGEVYNALFRFMSKFVFGYYKTLESYGTALGKRFKEDVKPERV